MEETFNPSEYTVKELVKKLYGDFHDFKEQYEKDKENPEIKHQIKNIEDRLKGVEIWVSERKGNDTGIEKFKSWIGWLVALLAAIIAIVSYL